MIQILRIVPLALYLRSAACKFGIPIGGCDGPLCPVAIGKAGLRADREHGGAVGVVPTRVDAVGEWFVGRGEGAVEGSVLGG